LADIHPKAVVENAEALGDDVRVGPFSYVGPEVTVGPGTRIGSGVTVLGRTAVGARCRLLTGSVIGCRPAGAAGDDDETGRCVIGDGNVIREHVTVELGHTDGGTRIGDDNLIMVGCHVGADAELDGEGIFANFTRIDEGAKIEPYVRTSGFTNVEAHTTVGAYTFTTGYAGIDRDAPPYAIVQGLPYRVRSVNVENLNRCGFTVEEVAAIKEAFRVLFNGRGGFPAAETIEQVRDATACRHVRLLADALAATIASPGGCRRLGGLGEST
jgi:UDP-N-acetylglucosamine acyltransferase